jgi:hypothetical protein
MYDRHTFHFAKHDLAYAMLRQTRIMSEEVKLDFLKRLLRIAAINGEIEPLDVEYAIKYSSVHNYPLTKDELKECLSWMNYQGKRYSGKLSKEQQQELQLLYELCERVVEEGDLYALQRIAELV